MTKKGFTLIELLVVISIIGILLALSVFGLQGAKQASRDAKRKADLEAIRQALELYKSDCDVYPANDKINTPGVALVGTGVGNCVGTYLSAVPEDPVGSGLRSYTYVLGTDDPPGHTYVICASLEQGSSSQTIAGCTGYSCGAGEDVVCNYMVANP